MILRGNISQVPSAKSSGGVYLIRSVIYVVVPVKFYFTVDSNTKILRSICWSCCYYKWVKLSLLMHWRSIKIKIGTAKVRKIANLRIFRYGMPYFWLILVRHMPYLPYRVLRPCPRHFAVGDKYRIKDKFTGINHNGVLRAVT